MPQVLIHDLIRQFREIQDGSPWFDQSFTDKLKGLTEAEGLTRPLPALHSVAEHLSHILEWRKECLRRLRDEYTDLMNSPDDWKDNTTIARTGWAALQQQFVASTADMISALQGRDDEYLQTPFREEGYTFHYLFEGIIQHDLYHLGQIGITLKLLRR